MPLHFRPAPCIMRGAIYSKKRPYYFSVKFLLGPWGPRSDNGGDQRGEYDSVMIKTMFLKKTRDNNAIRRFLLKRNMCHLMSKIQKNATPKIFCSGLCNV